jgi:hypothetical protein
MKPWIALHPGLVVSKSDGEQHFIDAPTLARLYQVQMAECIVWDDDDYSRDFYWDNYIHLFPDANGNYKRPEKTPRLGGRA